MSVFALVGVASLADMISSGLASLQIFTFATLLGGPQILITGAVAAVAKAIDFLFGTDIVATAAGGFTVFLSIQVFVALLTLCVFYVVMFVSPKGTYTISDYLIAAGVFLLEAMPFLCSFVFWGTFVSYLRQRKISGVGVGKGGGLLGKAKGLFLKK